MLGDRLVCGVTNDRIQRRLLTETTLDFDKALNKASSMELVENNALDLREHTGVVRDQGAVNKMTSFNSLHTPRALSFEEGSAVKCDHCGRPAHNQTRRVFFRQKQMSPPCVHSNYTYCDTYSKNNHPIFSFVEKYSTV